jgi:lipid-A-disaccharide synthase-like uncharacterized protein
MEKALWRRWARYSAPSAGPGQMIARLARLTPARLTEKAALMDFLQHEITHILAAIQGFEITPWKLVGLVGALMFTSRWFVQMYYTRKLKRVVMPLAFWWLSVIGSALQLSYFIVGKNDSVGIVANFFPAFVSVYNLIVHMREVKSRRVVESEV